MALNLLIDITKDEERAVKFLQHHNVLRSSPPNCASCGRLMTCIKIGRGDNKAYRCPQHKSIKIPLKSGTFFHNTNLKFTTIVRIVYFWAYKIPQYTVASLVGFTDNTVAVWFKNLRDVCSHWLDSNNYQIGGPGLVVEIDEILITARKFRKGQALPQRWIFGGVCIETGQGFLVLIPDKEERPSNIFLSLIQERIAAGSIIHTKDRSTFKGLVKIPVVPPYEHKVRSHDPNFADPVSGTSISRFEHFWKNAKNRFDTYAGVSSSTFQSHLDEFVWRELHGKTYEKALDNILLHISQYKVRFNLKRYIDEDKCCQPKIKVLHVEKKRDQLPILNIDSSMGEEIFSFQTAMEVNGFEGIEFCVKKGFRSIVEGIDERPLQSASYQDQEPTSIATVTVKSEPDDEDESSETEEKLRAWLASSCAYDIQDERGVRSSIKVEPISQNSVE